MKASLGSEFVKLIGLFDKINEDVLQEKFREYLNLTFKTWGRAYTKWR
jgi:hypothetical protein